MYSAWCRRVFLEGGRQSLLIPLQIEIYLRRTARVQSILFPSTSTSRPVTNFTTSTTVVLAPELYRQYRTYQRRITYSPLVHRYRTGTVNERVLVEKRELDLTTESGI